MCNIQKSNDLLSLFGEMKQIMVREGESSWVRGITLIIEALIPPNYGGKRSVDDAVRYVETTYRNMTSGNGSFSDFFIWRDNFDDRVNANRELDRIRADIWALIDH